MGFFMLDKLIVPYKKIRLRNLIRDFDYQQSEFRVIHSLLEFQPTTALDIGASYGVYAIFFSQHCKQVHAFEPVPVSFEILNYQLNKHNITNVTSHQLALSDTAGTRKMGIPKILGTRNYFRAGFDHINSDNSITVDAKSITIDQFSDKINDCSFIKIDVEGHEKSVLNGARQAIKKYKPSLLVELNDPPTKSNHRSFTILRTLQEMGYQCYFLNSVNKYQLWSTTANPASVNYFFLNQIHIDFLLESLPDCFV